MTTESEYQRQIEEKDKRIEELEEYAGKEEDSADEARALIHELADVLGTYNGLVKGIWRVPEEGSNEYHDIELTIHRKQHERIKEALTKFTKWKESQK